MNPEEGKENPAMIRAMYEAQSHAVTPSSSIILRRSAEGKRYTVTHKQTVTELNNQSGGDQRVSATFWLHDSPPYEPDL